MKYLFDNFPIIIVIVGICMLMLYPYIGAGLMLAALCFEAKQYVLMAATFLICMLLQGIMGRRIKPYHVPVKPSRASRRKKKAASDKGQGKDKDNDRDKSGMASEPAKATEVSGVSEGVSNGGREQ